MSIPLPHIIPMKPYLREMVWGGRRLEQFGKRLPAGTDIGESWEVSAYPGMESTVAAGPLASRSLRSLCEEYGPQFIGNAAWNTYAGSFPLLIKLIDANADLSIQVHPDDGYARAHDLERFGKMEAWFVLSPAKGRFACGLQDGTTRGAFAEAIAESRVLDQLKFYDAVPGQFVFVPPGVVHAACSGVMIYEVQQSSDLTFRLYDYDRTGSDGKPRELHVEHGLAVSDFDHPAPEPVQVDDWPAQQRVELARCEHFDLDLYAIEAAARCEHESGDGFFCLTVIAGAGLECRGCDGELCCLEIGDTALIPADRQVAVTAEERTQYMLASPPSTGLPTS